MSGGVDPYLCIDDFNELIDDVKNAQECGYPKDCSDVIEFFRKTKVELLFEN